jgi:hypothetical protein
MGYGTLHLVNLLASLHIEIKAVVSEQVEPEFFGLVGFIYNIFLQFVQLKN